MPPTLSAQHLSSNLTTLPQSLTSQLPSLPSDISNSKIPTRTLAADTTVQILDLHDIGRSTWSQIQDLEQEARGETVVGRNQIVRVVDHDPDDDDDEGAAPGPPITGASAAAANGPWKVLLQDVKGGLVYGFDGVGVLDAGRLGIGCKVLLKRGVRVDRGVVMLERGVAVVLGGRVEEIDRSWRNGRIARLKALLDGGRG